MAINSIISPSLQGIQNGTNGLRRVATEIASANTSNQAKPTDLSRAMVEMKTHAQQTKASAKALHIINDSLGAIIDEQV